MAENHQQQSLRIDRGQLLFFVREMIGLKSGREDDEHPLPPGPWDPVIRVALERINVSGLQLKSGLAFGYGVPWWSLRLGPHPEPWKVFFSTIAAGHPEIWDAIGGGPNISEEGELNSQRLPARIDFLVSLAQTVLSRAQLFQEIADATSRDGQKQSIIIVGGYIARFVDDICGNNFRLKWPFPPRPKWFAPELSGIDLVVMATQFDHTAKETFSPVLRQNLVDSSAKLIEVGLSKLNNS